MAYFKDLREFIQFLDKKGYLCRIKREVVRETDIGPLYWLQARAVPEAEWKSLFFENVVDVSGRKLGRVFTGGYGPNRESAAVVMNCQPEEINEKWCQAVFHPIEPEIVKSGPVQEVVRLEDELNDFTVAELAVPVEEPGFSGTITTTTEFITKDPDTGVRNVGMYRGSITGKGTVGFGGGGRGAGKHLRKARQKGIPLPVAIVIGVTPNINLCSKTQLPHGVDELAVAGGLAGEPVKLVKCKTIDLEVPATAEIVIEGTVVTEEGGGGGAFGEYPGVMAAGSSGERREVVKISAITHRRDPIFQAQFAGYGRHDSEGNLRHELETYRHLKHGCGLPVMDVVCFSGGIIVVQMAKATVPEPWEVLNSLIGKAWGVKVAIVVDEDIDPREPEAVNFALAYAVQANKDIRVQNYLAPYLDPSASPPGTPFQERGLGSALLIDATRKWGYTPIALPNKDYMERAIKIWQEEKLPTLRLRKPWHGYHLGYWAQDDEEKAKLTVRGEFDKLVEKMEAKGRKQAYID